MDSHNRWNDAIAADLPPTHGDEPATLRDSITDELNDHLQCALRSELLRNLDSETARQRVMARFGNVSGIARQLWFDAMREKILTQRVLLSTTGVMAAACVLISMVAWLSVNRVRAAMDSATIKTRSAMEQLRDARAENDELMKQLALFGSQDSGSEESVLLIDGGFEAFTPDGVDKNSWRVIARDVAVHIDADQQRHGDRCIRLESDEDADAAIGEVVQRVALEGVGGKRLRFRAAVRTELSEIARVGLFCRIFKTDADGRQVLIAADNMETRPIRSAEWTYYETVLPCDVDATSAQVGLNLMGQGKAWIDDTSLELVSDDTPLTAPAIQERRLGGEARPQGQPGQLKQLANPRMEETENGRVTNWSGIADTENPFEGKYSARLESGTRPVAGRMSAVTAQSLDASPYRGKRIRYRAAVRVETETDGRAQLWCRVDGPRNKSGQPKMLAFDNMQQRPITDTEWRHYEIVLDVADEAEFIMAGIFLLGDGKTWIDDASLEVVAEDAAVTTSQQVRAMVGTSPPQPFFTHWLWLPVVALLLFVLGQRTKLDENRLPADPGFVSKFAFRFSAAYWLLYFLPQPFSFIPGFGRVYVWHQGLMDTVVRWTALNVLGIQGDLISSANNGSGDTTFAYIQALVVFAAAIVVAVLWSAADWRKTDYRTAKDLLRSYVRYVLAFAMLGYGLAKVGAVMNQFAEPTAYQLNKTYGESSPMNLVWTFMGASRPYTVFSGLAECLAAVLLAWRRTTILGAAVAFSVMLNVAMLNFCYDVPVKLFSVHLLCMALYVALPDARRLANAFIFHRATESEDLRPPYAPGHWVWLQRALKIGVICIGVGMPIWSKVQTELAHARSIASQPAYFGKFSVDEFTIGGDPAGDASRWTNLDFKTRPFGMRGEPGPANYLTISSKSGISMHNFKPTESGFELTEPSANATLPSSLNVKQVDDDTFELTGNAQSGEIVVRLSRQNASEFLLMGRGFRWINEIPFNR